MLWLTNDTIPGLSTNMNHVSKFILFEFLLYIPDKFLSYN